MRFACIFDEIEKKNNEKKNCGHKAHWINWTQRSITLCFNKYINIHTRSGQKRDEKRRYRYPTEIYPTCVHKAKSATASLPSPPSLAAVANGSKAHTKNHRNRLTSFNSNGRGEKIGHSLFSIELRMMKCKNVLKHWAHRGWDLFYGWFRCSSLLVCSFKVFV